MSVVARFYVANVARNASAPDAVTVKLAAVGGRPENKSWAEATPSGSIEMVIQNPDAAELFMGTSVEFEVTFRRADRDTDEANTIGQPGAVSRGTLADPHDYVPSEWEKKTPDSGHNLRCAYCNCKRQSHDEPLRARLIRSMGL